MRIYVKGKIMKIKTLALLPFVALGLVSCSTTSTNTTTTTTTDSTSQSINLIKTIESKVYRAPTALGDVDPNSPVLNVSFFDISKDVPYIKVNEFLDTYFNGFLCGGQTVISCEDGVLTNNLTNVTMKFDVKNNTISTKDLDLFTSIMATDVIHRDVLSALTDSSASLVEDKCSRKAGKEMVWNLDDYYMNLVSYDKEVYVPFSILETIFLAPLGLTIAFNGNDFYYSNTAVMYTTDGKVNEFGKAYYSGSLANLASRSESYSKYFYGSFLFTMENYNGKYQTMGYTSLDEALEDKGFKTKLLSSDSLLADKALADVINSMFCDGGHTAFYNCGVNVSLDASRDKIMSKGLLKYDTRAVSSRRVEDVLQDERGVKTYKLTENLKISGQTAVISFDQFSLNAQNRVPTKETVADDKVSTFAILYNSFNTIKNINNNIKNVVIDVSLNGGGQAPALGEALGFLTNDDIVFTVENPVTGAINTETVKYDTDLDGDFNDDDSYEGMFNFYILTSDCSFSCGNALPCIAKDYGYAKIIGATSGGGDCTVGYACAIDGTSWQMSATASIIHKDGTNVDSGAVVDYKISVSHFYDVEWLNSYLNTL